jgi:hypothetical protein
LYITHFVNQLLMAAVAATFFHKVVSASSIYPVVYTFSGYVTFVPMIVLLPENGHKVGYKLAHWLFCVLVPPYTNGMGFFLIGETYFRLREVRETVAFWDFMNYLVAPMFVALGIHFAFLAYFLRVRDLMRDDTPLKDALLWSQQKGHPHNYDIGSGHAERFHKEDSGFKDTLEHMNHIEIRYSPSQKDVRSIGFCSLKFGSIGF